MDIKCSNCGTWNENVDYCTACNHPVSREAILKARDVVREEKTKEIPVPKLDKWIGNWKNSSNPILKYTYFLYDLYGNYIVYCLDGSIRSGIK
jgi:ribosomal protein L37E